MIQFKHDNYVFPPKREWELELWLFTWHNACAGLVLDGVQVIFQGNNYHTNVDRIFHCAVCRSMWLRDAGFSSETDQWAMFLIAATIRRIDYSVWKREPAATFREHEISSSCSIQENRMDWKNHSKFTTFTLCCQPQNRNAFIENLRRYTIPAATVNVALCRWSLDITGKLGVYFVVFLHCSSPRTFCLCVRILESTCWTVNNNSADPPFAIVFLCDF